MNAKIKEHSMQKSRSPSIIHAVVGVASPSFPCARQLRPEMLYSDDENRTGECDWCNDDRGMCDRFIELDEDRRFSIKLEETFDVHRVRNDENSFFS